MILFSPLLPSAVLNLDHYFIGNVQSLFLGFTLVSLLSLHVCALCLFSFTSIVSFWRAEEFCHGNDACVLDCIVLYSIALNRMYRNALHYVVPYRFVQCTVSYHFILCHIILHLTDHIISYHIVLSYFLTHCMVGIDVVSFCYIGLEGQSWQLKCHRSTRLHPGCAMPVTINNDILHVFVLSNPLSPHIQTLRPDGGLVRPGVQRTLSPALFP